MRSTLHDPVLTAEHRLWRAVLEQAYVDAESGLMRATCKPTTTTPPATARTNVFARVAICAETASQTQRRLSLYAASPKFPPIAC